MQEAKLDWGTGQLFGIEQWWTQDSRRTNPFPHWRSSSNSINNPDTNGWNHLRACPLILYTECTILRVHFYWSSSTVTYITTWIIAFLKYFAVFHSNVSNKPNSTPADILITLIFCVNRLFYTLQSAFTFIILI